MLHGPCLCCVVVFFFNDTATTEIYTLSLHDALPILAPADRREQGRPGGRHLQQRHVGGAEGIPGTPDQIGCTHQGCSGAVRSEEHTSELQSRQYLVCRLLLEKKKR